MKINMAIMITIIMIIIIISIILPRSWWQLSWIVICLCSADCDDDDHIDDNYCDIDNWGTTCASPSSGSSHWEYFLHSGPRQVRTSIINRKHTIIDLKCFQFCSNCISGAKTFQVFCQGWTQAAQRSHQLLSSWLSSSSTSSLPSSWC